MWATIRSGETSWTTSSVIGGFTAAAVLLVGFVGWELHTPEPMLDVRLFANRRFSVASVAIAFTYFALIGWFFLLTQYFQFIQGYSPLQAGLRLLPAALALMVFTIASAPVAQRFGTRVVVGFGLLLTAAGLALNALLLEADTDYPVVLAYLMVLAAGMAATMAPATDSIMGYVPPEKAGVGSAVNDTTRELGGALGVAVIGSLASARYTASMTAFFAGPGRAAPDDIADASTHQLGAAVGIAHQLGDAGTSLADAARTSFMNGWTSSLLIAAAVALVAAAATIALLASRAQPQPRPALAPDDVHGDAERIGIATPATRRGDRIPTAA